MERRDFIQETINTLVKASKEIDTLYKKLKSKEIDVPTFETEYKQILYWASMEDEREIPNNGCTYVLNDGSEVK